MNRLTLPLISLPLALLMLFGSGFVHFQPLASLFWQNMGAVQLLSSQTLLTNQPADSNLGQASFEQALTLNPSNERALRLVAIAQTLDADPAKAEPTWQNLAENPNILLIQWGQVLQNQNRLASAQLWFERAWQAGDPLAADVLGQFLHQHNQFAAAQNVYQTALAEFPNHLARAQWWLGVGRALEAQNQAGQAKNIYAQGLAEFPENAELLTYWGILVYQQDGAFETAEQAFLKAIASNPEYPEAYGAMADMLARENRHAEAFDWYTQALNLKDYFWWDLAQANMARDAGQIELAQTLYQNLLIEAPERATHIYRQIARAYFLNDQLLEATESIEKALQLHSNPPIGFYLQAGQIYEAQNQLDEAKFYYEQVLEISPRHSVALEGYERVSQ